MRPAAAHLLACTARSAGSSQAAFDVLCKGRADTCWINQPGSSGGCRMTSAGGGFIVPDPPCNQIITFVCRPSVCAAPAAGGSNATTTPGAAPAPAAAPTPSSSPAPAPIPTYTPLPAPPDSPPSTPPALPPGAVAYTPLTFTTPTSNVSAQLARFENTQAACDVYTCYYYPQPQLLPPDWAQPPPTNWWWSGWTHKRWASNDEQQPGIHPVSRKQQVATWFSKPGNPALTAAQETCIIHVHQHSRWYAGVLAPACPVRPLRPSR